MADCNNFKEMISSYADGELSGNDKNRLERHLEECASCRSLLSLYKSIAEAAAESLVEPPENFAKNVMSEIKKQPEGVPYKKKRPIRPVIISLVAAAACLALAFIVSPELFGLKSASNMTASAPMASTAPEAAYDADTRGTPPGDGTKYEMKTADMTPAASPEASAAGDAGDSGATGSAAGETAGVTSDAAGGGTASVPQLQMGIATATGAPTPSPNLASEYGAGGRSEQDKLKVYSAVFVISGTLPDSLKDLSMSDNGDGTFDIIITADTAAQLIKDGFTAEQGAADAVNALVEYTPGT